MNPELLLDVQTAVAVLALITPRVLILFQILPGFGSHVLPMPFRSAFALAITLPAARPVFNALRDVPPDLLLYLSLSVKEIILGLIMGTLLAIPLWACQSITGILDIQRSPIQTQGTNPGMDQDSSALGGLVVQAVTILMIEAGLFTGIVKLAMESYAFWPAYSMSPKFDVMQMTVFIKQLASLFWTIVVYGAPLLIPLILVDFAFAATGIFAPSLQVSFASSPIKSLLGLFMFFVYWPTFSHYIASDYFMMLKLMDKLFQQGV